LILIIREGQVRVADPDPHGSGLFLDAGSASALQ
jgi:hypothetical protein